MAFWFETHAAGLVITMDALHGQRETAQKITGSADLMIATTAASNRLPLYTANPDDFKGAEGYVEVVGVQARPNNF